MTHSRLAGLLLLLSALAVPLAAAEKAFGTVFLGNLKTGKSEFLKGYIGKGPLVLSFWATYCKPCKEEMPELQRLAAKHPGVELVFVNIDPRAKLPLVRKLVSDWGVTQTVLLDVYQVAAKKYIPGLKVPATFLIDSSGTIVYSSIGYTPKTIPQLAKRLAALK